jgi:hypothetical protein
MTKTFDRDPSHQRGDEVPRTPNKGAGNADKDTREEPQAAGSGTLGSGDSTEPRGERAGKHTSQGLAGAQGSGGGADRGINQPPPRAKVSPNRSAGASAEDDDSGVDPTR